MLIRQTSSSNILNFPYIDYGNAQIDAYLQTISGQMENCLSDWTLVLNLVFGLGEWIGVVKRGIPYPAAKEKLISITIPVPTTEVAPYGLSTKWFLHRPPLKSDNFFVLPVEWDNYSTLRDCLHDSAMRGIAEAFRRGITVGGKKIFYPDQRKPQLSTCTHPA